MTARRAVAAIAVIAAAAAAMWWYTSRSDEAEIRRRLNRLATEINAGAPEALGPTVSPRTIGRAKKTTPAGQRALGRPFAPRRSEPIPPTTSRSTWALGRRHSTD